MESGTTRRVLLGAAVAALAGCGGEGTATPKPEATPIDGETPGTDCPPTLTVYEVREEPVDEESAVAYVNLTETQRRTFDRARTEAVEEFDEAWYDIDVVSYEGTYYRASVAVC